MEDKEKGINQRKFFKEWLETLQQESWQLELLISGFALFGIWESKSAIDNISNYIAINQASELFDVISTAAIAVLSTGWVIFFINLLVHIILRGLWIGAIGLRYVSNEIDYEALNYSEWMTSYLKRKVGNYDDYIERLEKLCSVIFAYTFLLFFIFLSAALFFAGIGIFFSLLKDTFDINSSIGVFVQMMVSVYVILGFLVFLDFITLGMFKKVKDPTFAKVYGWIYRTYSYTTFSFMYRALLYNFLDDKYTKRLLLFSIPYVLFIVLIFPSLYTNAHPHFPYFDEANNIQKDVMEHITIRKNNYNDLREEAVKTGHFSKRSPIKSLSLDKYEVSGNYLKVFLALNQKDAKILEDRGVDPFFAKGLRTKIMDNVIEDSLLIDFDVKLSEAKSPILAARRAYREQLKQEGNSRKELKAIVDLKFDPKIDSINDLFESYKKEVIKSRFDKVRETFSNMAKLYLDDEKIELDLDLTKFYRHSNLGEKGLLCYIPIDSLSRGPHEIKMNRTYRYRDDKPQTYEISLPFMKMD